MNQLLRYEKNKKIFFKEKICKYTDEKQKKNNIKNNYQYDINKIYFRKMDNPRIIQIARE